MKQRVPDAPQPTFTNVTGPSSAQRFGRHLAAVNEAPAGATASRAFHKPALTTAFLQRSGFATLWLGGLLALCVASVTNSVLAGGSFAAGALLSVAFLYSQQWAVRRFVASKLPGSKYEGRDANIPISVIVAFKFILVGAAFGLALHYKVMVPPAFAAGFTLLQTVIFARFAGRMLRDSVRPIGQVYINDAKAG